MKLERQIIKCGFKLASAAHKTIFGIQLSVQHSVNKTFKFNFNAEKLLNLIFKNHKYICKTSLGVNSVAQNMTSVFG